MDGRAARTRSTSFPQADGSLGGLGGAAAELFLESGTIPAVFHRIGMRDKFSSIVGSQSYLQACYGMDEEAIVGKVQELLNRRVPAIKRPTLPSTQDSL